MRTSAKLGLSALIAALLLCAAIGTASARSLSLSNQNIRVTWSRLEFDGTFVTVTCQVTLEGSFHSRTIAKVIGSLIGAISRVNIKNESCTNGTIIPQNLPWHLTYEAFAGTLPAITDIYFLLSRLLLRLTAIGVTCELGRGNLTFGITLDRLSQASSVGPIVGRNILGLLRPETEPFGCSSKALFGLGTIVLANTANRISIRLI